VAGLLGFATLIPFADRTLGWPTGFGLGVAMTQFSEGFLVALQEACGRSGCKREHGHLGASRVDFGLDDL
jgi:hypothetical protein